MTDLKQANQRLHELRQEAAAARQRAGLAVMPAPLVDLLPKLDATTAAATEAPTAAETPQQTVKLYPSLAIAFYNKHMVAAGRVWLLLRAMDAQGGGWVYADRAREQLTGSGAWSIYTWKRLRQVLNEGEGKFWTRGDGRIWLHGAARVAQALDVDKLRGRPVALPISELLDGIQRVRAAFYASFHGSRRDNSKPISRRVLRQVTGCPERTQQIYDKVAGVTAVNNIVISRQPYTIEAAREAAWRRGRAAFRFKGAVAWRLPNSFESAYDRLPKGRQRKVNSQLSLVNNEGRANKLNVNRLYHPDSDAAAKAWGRTPERDHYFEQGRTLSPAAHKPTKFTGAAVWGIMAGING
jgi:hypothetical protein